MAKDTRETDAQWAQMDSERDSTGRPGKEVGISVNVTKMVAFFKKLWTKETTK